VVLLLVKELKEFLLYFQQLLQQAVVEVEEQDLHVLELEEQEDLEQVEQKVE
jgi:hypothetical protein